MGQSFVDLVAAVLARKRDAARALVEALYPIVQARVARVLWRARGRAGRDVRQEVDDMTQEVFAFLFQDDGRALRAWDPARGLSLPNFVGLLAERRTLSALRSGRQSPFGLDPTEPSALDDQVDPAPGPEPEALSREKLATLLDRLRLAVSPLGMHLFELLYVEEHPVEEVARLASMSTDAVYAWRSRLRKLVAKLAAELDAERTPIPVLRAAGQVRHHE